MVAQRERAHPCIARTGRKVHGYLRNRSEPESEHRVLHPAHARVGDRGSTHADSQGATGGGGTLRGSGGGLVRANPGQVGNRGGIAATTGGTLAPAEPDRRTTRDQLDPLWIGVLIMVIIDYGNLRFESEDSDEFFRLRETDLNFLITYIAADEQATGKDVLYTIDGYDDQWYVIVNFPFLLEQVENAVEIYAEERGEAAARYVPVENLLHCTLRDLFEDIAMHVCEEHVCEEST